MFHNETQKTLINDENSKKLILVSKWKRIRLPILERPSFMLIEIMFFQLKFHLSQLTIRKRFDADDINYIV